MRYDMDAVDDIPTELKLEIAAAITKELTHQLHTNVPDGFKLFRAGIAVCRSALQDQAGAAAIGEATQRALAGPELPHTESGVPIVPGDRETRFTRQERELRESPATWLPALLRTVVETAEEKEVFQEGGLLSFVKVVLEGRAE